MPEVFRKSKINLNITLRSIISGISLRVYDILGAGGSVSYTHLEMTADSKVSTASTVQITNTQKSGTDNGESNLAQQNEKKEASIKELKDIQKVINRNTIAEFGYNEPTNRITIKIKDKDTDEVIKEIPSEKALEMLAKAWELAGILVDEKR